MNLVTLIIAHFSYVSCYFFSEIVQNRPRPDDSGPLTLEKKWFAACMNEGELKNSNHQKKF